MPSLVRWLQASRTRPAAGSAPQVSAHHAFEVGSKEPTDRSLSAACSLASLCTALCRALLHHRQRRSKCVQRGHLRGGHEREVVRQLPCGNVPKRDRCDGLQYAPRARRSAAEATLFPPHVDRTGLGRSLRQRKILPPSVCITSSMLTGHIFIHRGPPRAGRVLSSAPLRVELSICWFRHRHRLRVPKCARTVPAGERMSDGQPSAKRLQRRVTCADGVDGNVCRV